MERLSTLQFKNKTKSWIIKKYLLQLSDQYSFLKKKVNSSAYINPYTEPQNLWWQLKGRGLGEGEGALQVCFVWFYLTLFCYWGCGTWLALRQSRPSAERRWGCLCSVNLLLALQCWCRLKHLFGGGIAKKKQEESHICALPTKEYALQCGNT